MALALCTAATAHDEPAPDRATPQAEADPKKLAEIQRLAQYEADYRARGDHHRAAGLRARIDTLKRELCLLPASHCSGAQTTPTKKPK